jgi:hypothetical protein
MRDSQRIRLRVTNESTGLAKNVRLALADLQQLTVWDAIYDNPVLELIRPQENNEQYEIQCSLLDDVLSTQDMKSIMVDELLQDTDDLKETIIRLVLHCQQQNKETIVQDTEDTVEVVLSERDLQFEEEIVKNEDPEDTVEAEGVEEIAINEDSGDAVQEIDSIALTLTTGKADIPQTIQVTIRNHFNKRSKDLVVYVSDDVNVYQHIYDNPSVHNAYVRTWSQDIVTEIKNETSVICCFIHGTSVVLSVAQMKETSTKQLFEYIPKDRISDPVQLVLNVIKANSLADEVSDVMTTTQEEIEAVALQSVQADDTEDNKDTAPLMEEDVSAEPTENMRVNIRNQFTRRFKELEVEVSDDLTIYQSIYDNHMVHDAHVRTWSPDIVTEVKNGTKDIICAILGTNVVLSVSQMKGTSTKQLMGYVSEDSTSNLVYLALGVVKIEASADTHEVVNSESMRAQTELEEKEEKEVAQDEEQEQDEKEREVCAISTDDTASEETVTAPSELEEKEEKAEEAVEDESKGDVCAISTGASASDAGDKEEESNAKEEATFSNPVEFRQRGWLPGTSSKHMRVNVRNQFTRRSKEILIEVSDTLSAYKEIYENPLVQDVRKWSPSIMEEINNETSEITCGIVGTPIVLTISQMEEASTKQLLEYASEQAKCDHVLVQLVLRVTRTEREETNKAVLIPEEAFRKEESVSTQRAAKGSEDSDDTVNQKEIQAVLIPEEAFRKEEPVSTQRAAKGSEDSDVTVNQKEIPCKRKSASEENAVNQCKDLVEIVAPEEDATEEEMSFKPTGFRQRGWLPKEDASTAKYMPVRITNQVTNRSKDLLVIVSKESTISQAIYENAAVREANVRKWPKDVAQEFKSKTAVVQCRLLDKTGAFVRTYSIDDMEETSTMDLFVRAPQCDDLIQLVLTCDELEVRKKANNCDILFDVETERKAQDHAKLAVNDADHTVELVIPAATLKTEASVAKEEAVKEGEDSASYTVQSQGAPEPIFEEESNKDELVSEEPEAVVEVELEEAPKDDESISSKGVSQVEAAEDMDDDVPEMVSEEESETEILESIVVIGEDTSDDAVEVFNPDDFTTKEESVSSNVESQKLTTQDMDGTAEMTMLGEEAKSEERASEEALVNNVEADVEEAEREEVEAKEVPPLEARDEEAQSLSSNAESHKPTAQDMDGTDIEAKQEEMASDEALVNDVLVTIEVAEREAVQAQEVAPLEARNGEAHRETDLPSFPKDATTKDSKKEQYLPKSSADCGSTIATRHEYEQVQVTMGHGMALKALQTPTKQQAVQGENNEGQGLKQDSPQTKPSEMESKQNILALTAKHEDFSKSLKSLILLAQEFQTAMNGREQARFKVSLMMPPRCLSSIS